MNIWLKKRSKTTTINWDDLLGDTFKEKWQEIVAAIQGICMLSDIAYVDAGEFASDLFDVSNGGYTTPPPCLGPFRVKVYSWLFNLYMDTSMDIWTYVIHSRNGKRHTLTVVNGPTTW